MKVYRSSIILAIPLEGIAGIGALVEFDVLIKFNSNYQPIQIFQKEEKVMGSIMAEIRHGGILGTLRTYAELAFYDGVNAANNLDYKVYKKFSDKKKENAEKDAAKAEEKPVEVKAETTETAKADDQSETAETTEVTAEIVPVETESSVTEATAEDLVIISDSPIAHLNLEQAQEIIAKAMDSHRDIDQTAIRLTCVASMYCLSMIDEEIVYKNLDPNNSDEIAALNTLISTWSGLTFNPSYPIPKIREISSDPTKVISILKLVAPILGDDICVDEMIISTKDRIKFEDAQRQAEEGVEVDPIEPISFVNKNLVLNDVPKYIVHPGLTEEQTDKLKNAFDGILNTYDYQFNNAGGIIELVIKRDDAGTFDNYIIDFGTLTGEGIHMLNVLPNGCAIPLSLKNDKDIISKVLANKMYQFTEEEQRRVEQIGLRSFDFYQAFDFSTYGKFVKFKINDKEREKLIQKMYYIMKSLPWNTEELPTEMPRMRWTKFKSIYSFDMACDDKVVTQPYLGFNNYLNLGVALRVRADRTIVTVNGKDYAFKTEKPAQQ